MQLKPTNKLLLEQIKLKRHVTDNTISLHGTLNGEHTNTNGNQEVNGDLEVDTKLAESNISTLENGAQAGTKDG